MLISQSSSQELALGGLGRSLNSARIGSQNICSFNESHFLTIGVHHLQRAGLKDFNREIISVFRNLDKRSYLASYQHFGNNFYQENQLQIQSGIQVLDDLKIGMGGLIKIVQKIEVGTEYQPAIELLLNAGISTKINCFFNYRLDWSDELKKQMINSEFVWWAKDRLAVLGGFQFDFQDSEILQFAWLYTLHKDLQIQQAFSFADERTFHFGLTFRWHAWTLQLAYSYQELSASRIGLSLFHLWK